MSEIMDGAPARPGRGRGGQDRPARGCGFVFDQGGASDNNLFQNVSNLQRTESDCLFGRAQILAECRGEMGSGAMMGRLAPEDRFHRL